MCINTGIGRKQKAESRKQKAESRKQKAENNSNGGFKCQESTDKNNCELHNSERKSWNKQCNGNWKRSSSFSVIMDRRTIFRKTDIACTICARDYKGFGMTCMNGVIEVWEST